ncbi:MULTISPECIES: hypothetical protein [unclassified Paenibacillus]|jgi:hypothetical protein|uniref:hypothetical protein n=1 Tax=unclassified Paenibacillus TaxID=185978 RepID=UPI0011157461|nr:MULTISPECIES: hypothetical protein [unclassified Paenibacillus]
MSTNHPIIEISRGEVYPLHLLGLSLEDEQDRLICVVSLNCGRCLSLLNQLTDLEENSQFKFLLVTNGTEEENAIIKEHLGVTFILISFAGRNFSDIGISSTPQAYLINLHGIVRGRKSIKQVEDINLWMEEESDGDN